MVKISFFEGEFVAISALAAKVSQEPFESGSLKDLYESCLDNIEDCKSFINSVVARGHLIPGDISTNAVGLEYISRFAAIYIWRLVNVYNLIFGAGIEASLRVIEPKEYLEFVSKFAERTFKVYREAIDMGALNQDARYLIPEGVLTRMVFSAPPRYLLKIASSLIGSPLNELRNIGRGIKKIIKNKFGLVMPEEKPLSNWNFWGKEDVKDGVHLNYQDMVESISVNMGVSGSLSMFAQLVRQRQFLCNIEPLEQTARRGEFVVPPNFPKELKDIYQELAKEAKQEQIELIEKRNPAFVYFLLLGQRTKANVYGNSFGVLDSSRARSEGVAQWEIRNQFGIPLTRELLKYQELTDKIGPRCWREGMCTEPSTFKKKKGFCPVYALEGKWKKKSLVELLEILSEPHEKFIV